MSFVYFSREGWGARTDLKRLGSIVSGDKRTEVHIHNTAAIDSSDDTPNLWTLSDAVRYMRGLQTARPDLGLDIPYNECIAILEPGQQWDYAIFEGRGLARSGAHTAGHNTVGIACSFMGNFDKVSGYNYIEGALYLLEDRYRNLRKTVMPKLGNSKNPYGWDMWGHRDTSTKSCPGNYVYPHLGIHRFTKMEDTVIIREGTKGYHIVPWQKRLNNALKANGIPLAPIPVEPVWHRGSPMTAAVVAYQRAAELPINVPQVELGALDDYTRDLLLRFPEQ